MAKKPPVAIRILERGANITDIPKFNSDAAPIYLEHFKPIIRDSKTKWHPHLSDGDIKKMEQDFYHFFDGCNPETQVLILAHIASEDRIASLIHHREKILKKDLETDDATEDIKEKACHIQLKKGDEAISIPIDILSQTSLRTYHEKGYIDLVDFFHTACYTYHEPIIQAFFEILDTVPEEALLEPKESFLYRIALASERANLPRDERVRLDKVTAEILETIDRAFPDLIRKIIEQENEYSRPKAISRVDLQNIMLQKFLLERGADPFRADIHQYPSLYDRALESENVCTLQTLFTFTCKKYCYKRNLSNALIVRLLSSIKEPNKGSQEPILMRMKDHTFPVKPYSADEIAELHRKGHLSLAPFIPEIFHKEYDIKILDACHKAGLLDFFSSSQDGGNIFHEMRDDRAFMDVYTLLNNSIEDWAKGILRSEKTNRDDVSLMNVCTLLYKTIEAWIIQSPPSEPLDSKKLRRSQESILRFFLSQKNTEGQTPLDIYQEKYPHLYDSILPLILEEDSELDTATQPSWTFTEEDKDLFERFKKAFLSSITKGEDITGGTAYLPSLNPPVVCASRSARASMGEPPASRREEASASAAAEEQPYRKGY